MLASYAICNSASRRLTEDVYTMPSPVLSHKQFISSRGLAFMITGRSRRASAVENMVLIRDLHSNSQHVLMKVILVVTSGSVIQGVGSTDGYRVFRGESRDLKLSKLLYYYSVNMYKLKSHFLTQLRPWFSVRGRTLCSGSHIIKWSYQIQSDFFSFLFFNMEILLLSKFRFSFEILILLLKSRLYFRNLDVTFEIQILISKQRLYFRNLDFTFKIQILLSKSRFYFRNLGFTFEIQILLLKSRLYFRNLDVTFEIQILHSKFRFCS